jgi:hypothetical protein
VPRADAGDGMTRWSRIDFSSLVPQDRSGMGLSLGISSLAGTQSPFAPPAFATHTLDLGVHWRYTLGGDYRFDVTAYRHMPGTDAISLIESRDPGYGARVEMALGSEKLRKGFVAEKGFVGLQLESGARVTLKRSGGGPMLYYRNSF